MISVAVPKTDVEAIDGPVGELVVPMKIAKEGYEACSIWVTSQLLYLSNEIGRQGVAITNTKTLFPEDAEVAQIIRLFGVRIQDYVLFEERQYDSIPN
jgi:hypothetical protein